MTQTQIDEAGQGKYADQVRDHKFDGIQEFDNQMPNWWLWTFYGACIFSLIYWLYYEGFAWGDHSYTRYKNDMAIAAANRVVAEVSDDSLVALSEDAGALEVGKEVFTVNCVACHGTTAGGTMAGAPLPGPNLTDNAWIHGGGPTQIHHTVANGVVEKGMLAWGPILGPTKVQQVTAYVMSLRNTNAEGGKPPEGEPYEDG